MDRIFLTKLSFAGTDLACYTAKAKLLFGGGLAQTHSIASSKNRN
jgi:hypothetical protein